MSSFCGIVQNIEKTIRLNVEKQMLQRVSEMEGKSAVLKTGKPAKNSQTSSWVKMLCAFEGREMSVDVYVGVWLPFCVDCKIVVIIIVIQLLQQSVSAWSISVQ